MTKEITSTYLWDRLAFILGDEATILGPRPVKRKHSVLDIDRNIYEREVFSTERFADDLDGDTVRGIVKDIQKFARLIAGGSPFDPHAETYVVHRLYSVKFSYFEDSPDRHKHDVEILCSATSDVEAIIGALKQWIFLQYGTPERYADLLSVYIREKETGPIFDEADTLPVGSRLLFAWRADQTVFSFDSTALSEISELLRKKRLR
jgi:hypothetical protein